MVAVAASLPKLLLAMMEVEGRLACLPPAGEITARTAAEAALEARVRQVLRGRITHGVHGTRVLLLGIAATRAEGTAAALRAWLATARMLTQEAA